MINKITWTSEAHYIDEHTGEIIPKKLITSGEYMIITKIKKSKVFNHTQGLVQWIYFCQKNIQLFLYK